jgi:hypothetical protein
MSLSGITKQVWGINPGTNDIIWDNVAISELWSRDKGLLNYLSGRA